MSMRYQRFVIELVTTLPEEKSTTPLEKMLHSNQEKILKLRLKQELKIIQII